VGAFVILLALLIAHELSRGGRSLSTAELTALVNKDEAVVVDIRPAKDFATGHIVGALNIPRSEEHTSELQSRLHLVCRLLLEKKKKTHKTNST